LSFLYPRRPSGAGASAPNTTAFQKEGDKWKQAITIPAALKALVLSDIHGNWAALRSVLRRSPEHDILICLGDYLSTSLGNRSVVQWVKNVRGHNSILLRGNSDSMDYYRTYGNLSRTDPRTEYGTLQSLSPTARFEVEGMRALAVHDYAKPDEYSASFRKREDLSPWITPEYIGRTLNLTGVDILLFGGMHLPYVAAASDLLIINPGAVGFNYDGDPRASYMILEVRGNKGTVRHARIPYDIAQAASDIAGAYADSHLGLQRARGFEALVRGESPKPFKWKRMWGITRWEGKSPSARAAHSGSKPWPNPRA